MIVKGKKLLSQSNFPGLLEEKVEIQYHKRIIKHSLVPLQIVVEP